MRGQGTCVLGHSTPQQGTFNAPSPCVLLKHLMKLLLGGDVKDYKTVLRLNCFEGKNKETAAICQEYPPLTEIPLQEIAVIFPHLLLGA